MGPHVKFLCAKEYCYSDNMATIEWKKIFTYYTTDRGVISKVYNRKNFKYLDIKKE